MKPILERVEKAVRVPIYQALFLKIAEPRVIRIILFIMYATCFTAGVTVVSNRPEQFLQVLGPRLAFVYGVLIIVASLPGLIAVLPGIWWLERVGIILLLTSVSWYVVIITYLGGRPVATALVIGFGLFLVARFIEIRGAQLAPREA